LEQDDQKYLKLTVLFGSTAQMTSSSTTVV
jgi:hypothetical protein